MTFFAAIAIAIAVSVIRRSQDGPGSQAASRLQIASRRSEVPALRSTPSPPEGERGAEAVATAAFETMRPDLAPERLPEIDRIQALLRSRNRADQGRGLKALESIADSGEKLAVLRGGMEALDPRLKSRALLLLKGLRGSEAAALAARVLQGDGPSWLRSQAAYALGDIGDAGTLPALWDASRTDDLDVRAGVASALDRFGQSGPMQELILDLAALLDHADGARREDAVLLMATIQTPAVIPALSKALNDPTNSRIREAAADALGRTARTEALPYLEAALQDPEARVRQAAQHALETIRAARQNP